MLYERLVRLHITPEIGDIPLDRITRDDVEKHLAVAVAAAHREGKSWAVIGATLGMTRQGAHTKYASA